MVCAGEFHGKRFTRLSYRKPVKSEQRRSRNDRFLFALGCASDDSAFAIRINILLSQAGI